jgi:hypothetical protein
MRSINGIKILNIVFVLIKKKIYRTIESVDENIRMIFKCNGMLNKMF